jgi:hypothetical protein
VRLASFLAMATVAGMLGACGLSLQGIEEVTSDGAPGDDGSDEPLGSDDGHARTDGTSAADSESHDSSAVLETGTRDACSAADGCYAIPTSWELVALAADRSTGCPRGFTAKQAMDLDEGPDTTNACSCTCATAQEPTCPSGPIAVSFDQLDATGAGQCGATGDPITNAPVGGCDTDLYYPTASYSSLDLEYTPPAAIGGQCSGEATGTGNVTYATQGRACLPDDAQSAGCSGHQCAPALAAPYRACVLQSGIQSCPGAPFTEQHLVGSGVSFACSSCGCSFTAICGGTVRLFTDQNCTQQELDIPADGECHDPDAPNTSYGSYIYVSNLPQDACTTTTPSTAQGVTLQNEETICCAP